MELILFKNIKTNEVVELVREAECTCVDCQCGNDCDCDCDCDNSCNCECDCECDCGCDCDNSCDCDCDCECDCECDCGCQDEVIRLIPNTNTASREKHLPEYKVVDDKIEVEVKHVMTEEHFIELIAIAYQNEIRKVYLKPGDKAIATFPYEKGAKLYSLCNLHDLWETDVE